MRTGDFFCKNFLKTVETYLDVEMATSKYGKAVYKYIYIYINSVLQSRQITLKENKTTFFFLISRISALTDQALKLYCLTTYGIYIIYLKRRKCENNFQYSLSFLLLVFSVD